MEIWGSYFGLPFPIGTARHLLNSGKTKWFFILKRKPDCRPLTFQVRRECLTRRQIKQRWMRRWKRLDLLFCFTLCTTTAEVKSLCSGPIGLLKIIDPCDRPLDPAYPWACGSFLGPGLNGCSLSFHCTPEVRNGQGRTNEVRAAVEGDLCPCAAQTAYWKLASKHRLVSSRWMMNLHSLAMLYLYFAMLLAAMQRREWTVKMWRELNCHMRYMLCIELFYIFSRGTKIITCRQLR